MRKQFAVLGLGSFGRSVALTLESMGIERTWNKESGRSNYWSCGKS